jgi:hypothetical protein
MNEVCYIFILLKGKLDNRHRTSHLRNFHTGFYLNVTKQPKYIGLRKAVAPPEPSVLYIYIYIELLLLFSAAIHTKVAIK